MSTLQSRTSTSPRAPATWLTQAWSAVPALLSSVGAVVVALLVGALVIALTGDDAVTAYRALFAGAFGNRRALGETLVAATPLILAGLGFAVAFRAGVFNIGLEGQLVLGALTAGLIGGFGFGMPAMIYLPLALIAAAVAGGIWGAIPGFLKAKTGAHEVITTIMLNYLAFRVSAAAIGADDVFPVDPGSRATERAAEASRLPRLLEGTRLHAGIVLALVAAVILWYLLFRTTFGYRVRAVGLSRGAAAYAGIRWGRTITTAMFVSGLLAGLGGAADALGLQGRYYDVRVGYGFTAIAVGMVGRNHPAGVVLAGLLFGALSSGATRMQNTAGTSREIVQVLQGLVILSVAALVAISHLRLGQSLLGRLPSRRTGERVRSDRTSEAVSEPELESRPNPPAI
ncbi:MAG: ABC transporter permease [Chloroflexota bacterium]|nr:ABC transporter permease [Chloroflexota bacterium]